MRIVNPSIRNLQIISSPGVGGRELIPPVLAQQLIRLGHPTWLMARPESVVESTGKMLDVPVLQTNMNGYFDPKAILALALFLRREKIQVIHAHWSKDLSNCIIASAMAGSIPLVLTKHVYSTQSKRDPFHTWVYKHTDKVVAVSKLVETNLMKTVNIKAEKIVTIYNGIDLDERWNSRRVKPGVLKTELKLPRTAKIVGFAGRMNEGKGPHLIIEAFLKIAKNNPTWHLLLVGKAVGEQEQVYLSRIREQVSMAKLCKRVHFISYRTDMPEVMRSFDIFVCASTFESFGMVVIEAMSMGCPVIGSASGGVPEIINAGKNGDLFEPGNSEQLAQVLNRYMQSDFLRKRVGRAGWLDVHKRFGLLQSAEAVADLYGKIICL